jgi:type II secretory pathway pseudopilin PulG
MDLGAYFGPPYPNQGPDFVKAFQSMSPKLYFSLSPQGRILTHYFLAIWGNFTTKNDPSISNAIANGASSPTPNAPNPASHWSTYTRASPNLINLNETGGTPVNVTLPFGGPPVLENGSLGY